MKRTPLLTPKNMYTQFDEQQEQLENSDTYEKDEYESYRNEEVNSLNS